MKFYKERNIKKPYKAEKGESRRRSSTA